VKLTWLLIWLTAVPMLLLLGTGCGGINANGSISPASFFLPGLMQNRPKADQNKNIVSHPPAAPAQTVDQSL